MCGKFSCKNAVRKQLTLQLSFGKNVSYEFSCKKCRKEAAEFPAKMLAASSAVKMPLGSS
jgi:hypothetical protein